MSKNRVHVCWNCCGFFLTKYKGRFPEILSESINNKRYLILGRWKQIWMINYLYLCSDIEKTDSYYRIDLSTRITLFCYIRHINEFIFLFQESLLYTSIPWDGMCWPGSVCAHCVRRLIWVDTLRRGHIVCFLAGLLIFSCYATLTISFIQQFCNHTTLKTCRQMFGKITVHKGIIVQYSSNHWGKRRVSPYDTYSNS